MCEVSRQDANLSANRYGTATTSRFDGGPPDVGEDGDGVVDAVTGLAVEHEAQVARPVDHRRERGGGAHHVEVDAHRSVLLAVREGDLDRLRVGPHQLAAERGELAVDVRDLLPHL